MSYFSRIVKSVTLHKQNDETPQYLVYVHDAVSKQNHSYNQAYKFANLINLNSTSQTVFLDLRRCIFHALIHKRNTLWYSVFNVYQNYLLIHPLFVCSLLIIVQYVSINIYFECYVLLISYASDLYSQLLIYIRKHYFL